MSIEIGFFLYAGFYLSLKTSSKIKNITQVYKWVPEKINNGRAEESNPAIDKDPIPE